MVYSFDLHLFFLFLYNGVTSPNLGHDRNKEDLMELIRLVHGRSTNTSMFSLIIFVGISETWRALVFMSCVNISPKDSLLLPLNLYWMVRILRRFLYFIIAFTRLDLRYFVQ